MLMTKDWQKNTKIWVLADSRIGNVNQALSLADKLGFGYQVKHLEYNFLSILPNYLLSLWPFHVKSHILKQLKAEELPDIIISSGRRTAAVALYLKKLSGNKCKVIQIMKPDLSPEDFDLIILPQHDNVPYILPNIVRVLGALTNVQHTLSTADYKLLEDHYNAPQKFIAVILGGATKGYHFSKSDGESLIKILKQATESHSMPLFITFSRRTPAEIKKLFQKEFDGPNIIYDPDSKGPNPYPAIIGKAEYIIITADSISMCSESASTGKPMYVFMPETFPLKKHKFFVQQLVDLGIAKKLEANTNFLDKYTYTPLNEVEKVVEAIKGKLL